MKYNFDEDKKQLFCALIILDAIVDKDKKFDVNFLSLDEQKLSPIFQKMVDKPVQRYSDHAVHQITPG